MEEEKSAEIEEEKKKDERTVEVIEHLLWR